MLTKVHSGLDPVPGVWWKPAHKAEKVWVAISFAWCMVLFAMMPLWHWKGGQNPSGIRRRVEPAHVVSDEALQEVAHVAPAQPQERSVVGAERRGGGRRIVVHGPSDRPPGWRWEAVRSR